MTVDAAVPTPATDRYVAMARDRFRRSADTAERFFEANEESIGRACERLATRFRDGGRLFVFGTGACVSDAQHVSVEFVHPVIVGKRALPAIALTCDAGSVTGAGSDEMFAHQLEVLAGPRDIALGLATERLDGPTARGLRAAGAKGLLTIAVVGRDDGDEPDADLAFAVPSDDPLVVQEVQETLYHVLWELVHVFLERGGPDA